MDRVGRSPAPETLRAIDGVLGPRPSAWLAPDVELTDTACGWVYRGRDAVVIQLAAVLGELDDERVRLTVDVGRAVAEWAPLEGMDGVALACAFEIEDATVRRMRLYYGVYAAARAAGDR